MVPILKGSFCPIRRRRTSLCVMLKK